MATTTISVDGMTCDGCEEVVVSALSEVSGVEEAKADREDGTATVDGDAELEELLEAIDFSGYDGTYDDGEADEADEE